MTRFDRKFFTSMMLMCAILFTSTSFALGFDEGMYAPDKVVTLPLLKKGLKIKPTDIYNPKTGGISEAVIRLDTGCTGEFISPQGLILTNHHCGFDALVAASAVGKDYGKDGYKSDSIKDELPAKDYSISIPIRTEDVTKAITAGTENLTGEARDQAIKANIANLEKDETAKIAEGNTIRILPVSNGFFYYLYENKQIKDIRVVYAPPQMIGFYGGDPDNFEWSRHTGDFTFLRAYVAPDGTSADYSPNNVPFKPRKFLTISLNGVKEDDFVFMMGYPGGTTRYRESQSVNYAEKVNFPFLYEYITAWIGGMEQVGKADEAKRIAMQGDVANLANSQKLYQGGSIALRRGAAVAGKERDEAKFTAWVNANPARKAKYGNLLSDISKTSADFYKSAERDRILRTIPNLGNTPVYREFIDAISAVKAGKPLDDKKRLEIEAVYKTREPIVEREMLKFFFGKLGKLPENQRFSAGDRITGNKAATIADLISLLTEKDDFSTAEKIIALYSMSLSDIKAKWTTLSDFALAHSDEQALIFPRTNKFNSEINSLRFMYMSGISEMKGLTPYPDANFTQRLSFGAIKGYRPREAVIYTPFTTLKGVIEKDTGVFPFDVPQKLKDLQAAKDFGRFGVGDSVPVNFLSTTDSIGGNSGSPIMNGNGEQVGLLFDGNYEGLANDLFFSPDYGRSISVDIRYVLFVTEKFGGAGWILNEMKFAAPKAKAKGK